MISDALLIAQVNGETEDLTTLRRMEKAAIAAVQKRTGRYYGAVAAQTEILDWKGGPLQLSNVPISITTFKSWSGSAWTTVDATTYYLQGAFIRWNSPRAWSSLAFPTVYEVVYQAGYTAVGDVWPAPDDIQQAVLLAVGHWFRNREAVGESLDELPLSVTWLLEPNVKTAV